MNSTLHLAVTLLLTGATAHAQVSSPDKLIGQPPAPQHRVQPKPTDDLQWLWQYAKPSPMGNKTALLADPRFANLLADNFKAPQSMWGNGVPLDEAAYTFLGGDGAVSPSGDGVNANRFLTITGCVADHCQQRGLFYAYLGKRNPMLVFAALRWDEQDKTVDQPNAPYSLWLFPSRTLDPQHLPEALWNLLHDWLWLQPSACLPYQITRAIIVAPNGTPSTIGNLEADVTPKACKTTSGLKP
jgi:hypothetical protein